MSEGKEVGRRLKEQHPEQQAQFPQSWVVVPLAEVATLNPTRQAIDLPLSTPLPFVAMSSVGAEFGGISISTERPLHEVSKGYTQFCSGDVLMAKITPCMENGKLAVVPELSAPVGYGSTEFHVLRATEATEPRWIAHFVSQSTFRRDAKRNMSGSAGQLRVPGRWLDDQMFPLAPKHEQQRILAKLDELFSDLDAGVAALLRARANLKRYRAAVLKAAVEGRLTLEWRAKHPPTETGAELLARLLRERRLRWEHAQLAKFEASGKTPPKDWRSKYVEPAAPDTTTLPALPDGWCWANLEQLVERSEYGSSVKCSYDGKHQPVLRIPNIAKGELDLSDIKFATIDLGDNTDDYALAGDMLVCRTNGSIRLLGKCAVVKAAPLLPHHFASYLLRFRLTERECLPAWVHLFLSSIPGRRFIEHNAASSAGQHNISLSTLHQMPIPLPPVSEAEMAFQQSTQTLSAIDRQERDIERALKRAASLRQSILKRAFSGKLVPQDPTDEPASVLLERIRAARTKATASRPKAAQGKRASGI